MYAFFTRKAQSITTLPPRLDWNQILVEELSEIESPPKVYFTYNPAFCWRDSSASVEYEPLSDKIRVCKQLVKSSEDFRGALRRELYWRETSSKYEATADYVKGVILSCKAEVNAVANLDSTTAKIGTKLCSLLQAKRKVPNAKQCQMDEWHFYTRQLVEDYFYVYDN
mmetsp:Transcript_18154/g.32517  ORF Transcript_18154/g.32517 Transcript_18154/m.32517 type:complete len:168 (-) Transcript_18154:176-679(-)